MTKHAVKDLKKKEPSCVVGGMEPITSTMENGMEFRQKTKSRTII